MTPRFFFAISSIIDRMNRWMILLLSLWLVSCSGLEKSEQKKVRKNNLTLSYIHRHKQEGGISIPPPTLAKQKVYPWENKRIGPNLRITKEFFRCRGNSLNPPIPITTSDNRLIYHLDCGGIRSHSLPIREGKEFIYPILIELLNHIQTQTGKKVIITCGHRCPTHHLYADPRKQNPTSKHQIGAAVDFYLEEEETLESVVKVLMDYYKQREKAAKYTRFRSSPRGWSNHEITIKVYQKQEGRDVDNDHSFPYLTLEVKYDREKKRRVAYSWHRAHNNTYKR